MNTNSTIKRLSALILAGSIATLGAFAADTTPTAPATSAAPAPAAKADTAATAPSNTASSEPKMNHHRKHHRTADTSKTEGKAWFGGIVENSSLEQKGTHGGAPDVMLTKVFRDSPAYKAGLRKGDVIWKFDGERLTKTTQLKHDLREQKPGDTVRLEIYRHGKHEELKVKLGSLPTATASHSSSTKALRG